MKLMGSLLNLFNYYYPPYTLIYLNFTKKNTKNQK